MDAFTVTSFNTRWGRTVDDAPFDLARTLAAFDSDVICLQEVWEPADGSGPLGAVATDLGYRLVKAPLAASFVIPRPEITEHPGQAAGTWGVALLSRLDVRRVRIVDLGRLFERWDVATRLAILADVQAGPAAVTIAAHHLSFALPNAITQLRRLGGYLPSHQPSVVAGDCNLWGPVAVRALGRHRRAVRGRTWPAHRPHSQLDHLLVSPSLQVLDSAVLAPAGSDHLPVQATLALTAPP
ncbi:MAG: endonuclease/exonuclease/phosphatase family protein [Acidimicrobiales bacterium]